MGIPEIMAKLDAFAAERDWHQFHTTENLAKSISIEAAELLELFQWSQTPAVSRIEEELADVLAYSFYLASNLGVNPIEILENKINSNAEKYPVEKSRGKSDKYDQL